MSLSPAGEDEPEPRGGVHQDVNVTGDGNTVHQAGRDLIVYGRGVAPPRTSPAPAECPYPGLASFERKQADWFFGRDKAASGLVRRVIEQVGDGGLVAVVAPSGAGKSSLLRAGLVPRLESGLPIADSRAWPHRLMTPTAHPLAVLCDRLADLDGDGPSAPSGTRDPDELFAWSRHRVEAWRAAHGDPRARLILIVDQFEELFTLCGDEGERQAFVTVLARLAEPGPDGVTLAAPVLGLRADFYTRCLGYEPLRGALETRPILLGPMSVEELRAAIVSPAHVVGLDVEPGLVELLLRDLGVVPGAEAGRRGEDAYEAGRLPFLAYALQATWQERHGAMLTVDGYTTTGGIRDAIARRAERIYQRLDDDGKRVARTLLLRLVKIGDGTEDTRRPLARAELIPAGPDGERAAALLDAFTRERLLSQDRDTVEITHDVLLRGWPRLRTWIDQDRADALVRQELEEDAAAWEHGGRELSLLYRGTRLETARRSASAVPSGAPSPAASAFLAASLRQQRRVRRLSRAAVVVVTVLAVIASVAAVIAVRDQNSAVQARDQAVFNELLAEGSQLGGGDASLAAQLDLIAYHMQPASEQAVTALADTEDAPLSRVLTQGDHAFQGLAYSPNGRVLAITYQNTVQLWNVADPARPSALSPRVEVDADKVLNGVAFTPDGHTLAIASGDGTVNLWNVTDPARPHAWSPPLTGHTAAVTSVAFSPDGRLLAGAGLDGSIRLWDVADPAHPRALGPPLTGHTAAVESIAFDPTGHVLASAGLDGTIRLWDLTDPAHPAGLGQPLTGSGDGFAAVAFSPDGRLLAGGDEGGFSRLWNVADPAHPAALGQGFVSGTLTGPVDTVAFSPDSLTLATGTDIGGISLWNLEDPALPLRISPDPTGHTDGVNAMAFSPDGHTLASAGRDGTVRLWALPRDRLETGIAWSLATSPDKRLAVSAGSYGTGGTGDLQVWNISDPAAPIASSPPVPTHSGYIKTAAFDRDGQTLVTGSGDGTVQLWNLSNPADPVALGPPLPAGGDQVLAAAFSPDGRVLATSVDRNGLCLLQLWNVADPAHPAPLSQPMRVWSASAGSIPDTLAALAFSPDGRLLAGGGSDQTVRLWNISDPTRPTPLKTLTGHTNSITTLAFSPDGHTLASAGDDRTIRLWNMTDLAQPPAVLRGPTGDITSVAFSPDGHTLASAGNDGTIRLWDVTDPVAPAAVGQPLTGGDSQTPPYAVAFGSDNHTLLSAGIDGTVRTWDLRPTTAATWVCAATGGGITRAQWSQYVSPQLPYTPPCAGTP